MRMATYRAISHLKFKPIRCLKNYIRTLIYLFALILFQFISCVSSKSVFQPLTCAPHLVGPSPSRWPPACLPELAPPPEVGPPAEPGPGQRHGGGSIFRFTLSISAFDSPAGTGWSYMRHSATEVSWAAPAAVG